MHNGSFVCCLVHADNGVWFMGSLALADLCLGKKDLKLVLYQENIISE